ncbi:protein-disulfide reductase DsbD domain-containing protein, partial [Stappia sp.]|uniref:protein-disulfide reductase DsbD domain-containing protein n=1 Tax=Stappia sp. TaxID=1870903 RepID=UPI003A98D7F8
ETEWQTVAGAHVRVIATGPQDTSPVGDAAVQIRLDPGWHTYWRFPGEAGIPTTADFAGSTGIGGARLRFPPPETYSDPYSTSIVYRDEVVLPIDLDAGTAAGNATLRVHLVFGVCREICVPGEARFEVPLSDAEPDFAARMAIASARLSLPGPQGEAPPRVASIRLSGDTAAAGTPGKTGEKLAISVELPAGAGDLALYAEGAPGSYNGVPRLVSREGDDAVFSLPLQGLQQADDGSRPLSLMLVVDGNAVEHQVDLSRLPPD